MNFLMMYCKHVCYKSCRLISQRMDPFTFAFIISLLFSKVIHNYNSQSTDELEHQLANHCIIHMVGLDYSIPGKKFKSKQHNESELFLPTSKMEFVETNVFMTLVHVTKMSSNGIITTNEVITIVVLPEI